MAFLALSWSKATFLDALAAPSNTSLTLPSFPPVSLSIAPNHPVLSSNFCAFSSTPPAASSIFFKELVASSISFTKSWYISFSVPTAVEDASSANFLSTDNAIKSLAICNLCFSISLESAISADNSASKIISIFLCLPVDAISL